MALLTWVLWVLRRQRWWWHGPGVMVYSVAETSLLRGSRELIWWGIYDYGVMPVRYLMELPVDVIGYSMTAGVVLYLRRLGELERIKLENLNLQLHGGGLRGTASGRLDAEPAGGVFTANFATG